MLRPSLDMGEPFTVSTDIIDEELSRVHGHYMVIIRLMIHVPQKAQSSCSRNQ